MPIQLLNNYPESFLDKHITKRDGSPLYGEIWIYQQFIKINNLNLLPDEKWYLKHDYNLSTHPWSKGKVEGQVDFLLMSKYGLLIIEVKGGGLSVDEDDRYYSSNSKGGRYETQNPFNQAKGYTHTLIELIDKKIFVYRAVVLPHEAGFNLVGPQLSDYENLFFSKKDFAELDEKLDAELITKKFFSFLVNLAKSSRRKILKQLNPNWNIEKINKKLFDEYPELSSKQINSLKSELLPPQSNYGYNPERINSEIILNENYEILKGLRRNRKVIVQGAPGTGKTVLAKKFFADCILKDQKGIFYCANKLIQSKLEHSILRDYGVDTRLIEFKIFHENSINEKINQEVEYVIFDEAQEYFNKGLYEFIEKIERNLEFPKFLILYDPKQTILNEFNDISFYTDFFVQNNFTHYFFDETYRCAQNPSITQLSLKVFENKEIKPNQKTIEPKKKLEFLNEVIHDARFTKSEKIILVHSKLLDSFKELVGIIFADEIEELTEQNINLASTKVRYTTPIKYRGMEKKSVYLITNCLKDKSRVQNYLAVTRAMEDIKIAVWG